MAYLKRMPDATVFYDLDQLRERLAGHGFEAETGKTDQFFWWANAVRVS
jgi:hypothetical protein